MNSRQQTLLQLVVERQRIRVAELAERLQVSMVTVRHDLNWLEQQGYLTRAHGFAVALDSDDVDTRMMSNYALKLRLAQFAATGVAPGETVFIEGGSCNALLARELARQQGITIITASSYIAHQVQASACEVILLGGQLQQKSDSLVGPLTRRCLDWVHFSKAFLGIDGFCAATGFTGRDMLRADLVNAVLAKGAENIVLTDSSKFGVLQPYPLVPTDVIARVITDAGLEPCHIATLQALGIVLDRVN